MSYGFNLVKRGRNRAKTLTHKTEQVSSHDFSCQQCAFANDGDSCRAHPCDPGEFPEQGLKHGVTIIWIARNRLENHE